MLEQGCADCGAQVPKVGRGRPRIRCMSCSPEQVAPPGTYAHQRDAVCPQCGSEFMARNALTKYCSPRCRTAAGNAMQARRAAASSGAWRLTEKSCAHCSTDFFRSSKHQKFCSHACKQSAESLRRGGNSCRRRARKFGCEWQFVDRILVFERDGWRCKFCGIPTPRRLLGTRETNAPVLDHVVPLARGGAHAYCNVQCLCHGCNGFKGSKTVEELNEALAL